MRGEINFQRRHFQFIADTLLIDLAHEPEIRTMVAQTFARRLAGTNPQFDRGRFLKACGVED